MRLAVGYPWSSPFVWTRFAEHLPNLRRPAGVDVRFLRGAGWCPARRHAHICEQALAWGADLILIIGADQIHPDDLLERLVERHRQGCEVIAALVPARGFVGWQDMKPFQPMAWRLKRQTGDAAAVNQALHTPNEIEAVDVGAGELQEINFIGSGVLLFPARLLERLPQPWFAEEVDPTTYQRTACMDTRFVWKLQEQAHARVWLDTAIRVRHIHAFEIDETFQDRFADWARPGAGDPAICMFKPAEKVAAPVTAAVA